MLACSADSVPDRTGLQSAMEDDFCGWEEDVDGLQSGAGASSADSARSKRGRRPSAPQDPLKACLLPSCSDPCKPAFPLLHAAHTALGEHELSCFRFFGKEVKRKLFEEMKCDL